MPEIIVKLGERIIHRYFFDKDVLSVGRARDNDIVIENLSVSRNHARIKREEGKYFLTDMNSANGSLVNGVRVTKTEVFHNDVITIGKHTLHFQNTEEELEGGLADKPTSDSKQSAIPTEGMIGVLAVTKGKQTGQEFPVQKPETFIGRASENDIRLHDWFVSKKHACIRRQGGTFTLKDLDSWRGTTIDGASVREVELKPGNEIIFGTTVLKFRLANADEFARMHPSPDTPSQIPFEGDKAWESTGLSKPGLPVPAELAGEPPTSAPRDSASGAVQPDKSTSTTGTPLAPPLASSGGVRTAETEMASDEEGIKIDFAPKTTKPPAAKKSPVPPPVPPPKSQPPVSESRDEDEFAPMTEDELEALEREADLHDGTPEEEADARRMSWEMHQSEKMFDLGEDEEHFSLMEKDSELTEEEEASLNREEALSGLHDREHRPSGISIEEEEKEEEAALAGLLATGNSDETNPESGGQKRADATEAEQMLKTAPVDGAKLKEIRMWEKALKNKSQIIRKNAAKELKKLTGNDYDWKSEPAGS